MFGILYLMAFKEVVGWGTVYQTNINKQTNFFETSKHWVETSFKVC